MYFPNHFRIVKIFSWKKKKNDVSKKSGEAFTFFISTLLDKNITVAVFTYLLINIYDLLTDKLILPQ